jgi:hypothetical protein
MKKSIALMMFGIALLVHSGAKAQLNVNISAQPLWGPTGYNHVDYYYLPDIETYYSVPKRQYVYQNNNSWVFSNALPEKYANYNVYNGYKVVRNGAKPYLNFSSDKVAYAKYKNSGNKQTIIKNSKDKKYFVVKGHPHGMPPGQAKKIYKGNNNVKGNGNSKAHGNGKGKH